MNLRQREIVTRRRATIAAGICIAVAIFFFLVKPQRAALGLPKDILHLHLNEEYRGDEAKGIVDKMHLKSVAPDENAIGMYRSSNGCAALYLSRYQTSEAAVAQCEKMTGLIREGRESVFTHFRELSIHERKVYLCLGLGQAHYFFLTGKDLYWLAVDLPIAQASIQELTRIVTGIK